MSAAVVIAGCVEREGLGRLDGPERERLRAEEQGILPEERMRFRRAGHDAIDEIVQPNAGAGDPGERLSGHVPRGGLFAHEFAQSMGVVLDEFARKNRHGRGSGLEAREEHGEKLRGKGFRRFAAARGVGVVEREAGLGCVRDDPAQVCRARDVEHFGPLRAGVKRATDGIDDLSLIHDAAFVKALDRDVVAAAGAVQRLGALGAGRLDDDDFSERRIGVAIGLGNEEIDERAEKIARAELQDGFAHSVTPCFQIVISRKPLISLRASLRPLATSRMRLTRSSVTVSGATPGSSRRPALKSIHVGLRVASEEFDAIFNVGTGTPSGVPRPVVKSTQCAPAAVSAVAETPSWRAPARGKDLRAFAARIRRSPRCASPGRGRPSGCSQAIFPRAS